MEDEVKRPRGRPTIYTEEIAREICERLARGESLHRMCKDLHLPSDDCVRKWAAEDYQGFYSRYAYHRQLGLDKMADELLDIADDGTNDFMADKNGGRIPNNEHINRSRLRVDTRKWYLSKLAPKRYGEKVDVNVGGQENGAPLTTVIRWEK